MSDGGLLLLRLVLLVIMSFHGTQKLFGDLDRAERFFASQGFRPPRLMAVIAGLTETTGAVLIGTGLFTVIGVAMLTGVLTNVAALHIRNGLDSRQHGFELELMILAGVATIALCGPGKWSLDALFGVPAWPWLAPAALLAGFVGGIIIVNTRHIQPSLGKQPAVEGK